jgi:ATP synthase protein I
LGGSSLFFAARRVIQFQALTIAAVSLLAFAVVGLAEAKSVLMGGMAAFLPNLYFAIKFGRHNPALSAREVVNAFYVGEGVKLALTALLFALIFQIPGVLVMPLFIGFIAAIMVFWFALLLRT